MLALYLMGAIGFGLVGSRLGREREVGSAAGFFWGILLNVVGLAVILLSPQADAHQTDFRHVADELQYYRHLLDTGAITPAEYLRKQSEWV